jgi:HAD superfamily phosphatase (TIGR01668 family)
MLLPDIYLSSATLITSGDLRARGIQGLLLDIDGTLKDFESHDVGPSVLAWLQQLKADGIRMCLLSNGRARRIGPLAAQLQLPFVAEALKPSPKGCRRALETIGLSASCVAIVGDQIFADVLAGRLAGLHTVLVRPSSRVEPWFTRLKRPLEVPFLMLIRKRLDVLSPSLSTRSANGAAT